MVVTYLSIHCIYCLTAWLPGGEGSVGQGEIQLSHGNMGNMGSTKNIGNTGNTKERKT